MTYVTSSYDKNHDLTDRICINGRSFEVAVTLSETFGKDKSLQGGRILSFLISEEGVAVGYFSDGYWRIKPDQDDDELSLAILYFMEKFNTSRRTGSIDNCCIATFKEN